MKLWTRMALGAALALAASVVTAESAAGHPDSNSAGAMVRIEVAKTDSTILGTDITDCYYSGGYRGCSFFDADPDPELFRVCDLMADGRYTKGRIKFGGSVVELGPVETFDPNGIACTPTLSLYMPEGTHLGIHTGIEGLGWTAYEYGYA